MFGLEECLKYDYQADYGEDGPDDSHCPPSFLFQLSAVHGEHSFTRRHRPQEGLFLRARFLNARLFRRAD